MTQTAPLAITMGDPSGIGPEIVAKTLAKGAESVVVFGSSVVMEDVVRRLDLGLKVKRIADPQEARTEPRSIEVIEATQIIAPPPLGSISAISGQASFDAVVAAIAAAKTGKVSGIVTAPINKEAMASAGIRYPGHTEILAEYGLSLIHISEPTRPLYISYAVFCLKKQRDRNGSQMLLRIA